MTCSRRSGHTRSASGGGAEGDFHDEAPHPDAAQHRRWIATRLLANRHSYWLRRRASPSSVPDRPGYAVIVKGALDPALVFIGFMAAGKSRAARAAGVAGLETLDTDLALEAELGMPVGDFFDRHGEAEFRRRETALAVAALERAHGSAIALGGGAVLSEAVRAALARHVCVWIKPPPEELWRRAEGSARPLARERGTFERLYREREPLYRELADAVLLSADAVPRALDSLRALADTRPGRLIWAESASGDYPAWVGEGMLSRAPWPAPGGRFCVTDSTVAGLYRDSVEPLSALIAVEPGEQAKTLAGAERVLRELARAGMSRRDHVVALGGGVIGDLAGFCAATYQRGVAVVQVPTTLLAQVDSAYGGKTGVDLPEAKNYVGAYHLPAGVIADTATLRSLPREELAAGFVELLKTALIAGGETWRRARSLDPKDPEGFTDAVFDCAVTKVEVVAADERDAGRRAILNLGHTVGHAIEAASGYARYRHGEAVGLGLLAALRLSAAEDLRAELAAILERHGLPTGLEEEPSTEAILEALERDKKRGARGVEFVLLERPGTPLVGQPLDPASVRSAVEELRT
jgi:shikimate kinase/3-dehydroquinate synthase